MREISLKASTKHLFKDVIKRLLIPAFSNCQINDITTGQIQAYVSKRAKLVKPNTIRNELTVIKLLFRQALRWGYIKNNPTENVERPKIEKAEIEILSPEEIELMLKKAEQPYRIAFLTAFLTGMRAGELWGLQWGDIDWNSKQIYVNHSVWKKHFQTPKE